MRELEEARKAWQIFQNYTTLADLKTAVRSDASESSSSFGSRSLYWKVGQALAGKLHLQY